MTPHCMMAALLVLCALCRGLYSVPVVRDNAISYQALSCSPSTTCPKWTFCQRNKYQCMPCTVCEKPEPAHINRPACSMPAICVQSTQYYYKTCPPLTVSAGQQCTGSCQPRPVTDSRTPMPRPALGTVCHIVCGTNHQTVVCTWQRNKTGTGYYATWNATLIDGIVAEEANFSEPTPLTVTDTNDTNSKIVISAVTADNRTRPPVDADDELVGSELVVILAAVSAGVFVCVVALAGVAVCIMCRHSGKSNTSTSQGYKPDFPPPSIFQCLLDIQCGEPTPGLTPVESEDPSDSLLPPSDAVTSSTFAMTHRPRAVEHVDEDVSRSSVTYSNNNNSARELRSDWTSQKYRDQRFRPY